MTTLDATATGGRRRRQGQEGFTFVEMLITMIILGLLAAVMIAAVLGQREKAEGASAQSLLRTGASTVEAAVVDTDSYSDLTTARLAATEPNLGWLPAPGARAPENEVSVAGLSAQGYTLSTASASGRVYVLSKDLASTPTITRTCGPGCDW